MGIKIKVFDNVAKNNYFHNFFKLKSNPCLCLVLKLGESFSEKS